MPRLLPLLASLSLLLPPAPLVAQRSISLVVFTGNAAGHARVEADPDHPTITPDHPAAWAVAIAQEHRAWRAGLRVQHTRADLAIRGGTSAVLTRGAIRSWGVGMEGGRRVAGRTAAPTLHALLGVGLERTTFPVTGGDPRTVMASHVALEGAVPLHRRWRALVRGEVGRSEGLFGTDELPPGYAVRAGRRWNLGVGIGWRP